MTARQMTRLLTAAAIVGAALGGDPTAHACELGNVECADQKLLALGVDPREIAEMDLATRRYVQAIHCPPDDAMHPGRCDGVQDGPGSSYAWKRMMDEQHAAHTHACQQGYAVPGSC